MLEFFCVFFAGVSVTNICAVAERNKTVFAAVAAVQWRGGGEERLPGVRG